MYVSTRRNATRAMRQTLLVLLAASLAMLAVIGTARADDMSFSRYGLNSGDKVKITVFGEEDMEVETRLSDAGTISYPFLGEIRVKGKTVGQLQNFLTQKLTGDYFIDPKVSVAITEYRKFFVSGEVKDPGGFSFEPGLTLEKAVALAGGFTQRASRKDIIVSREEKGKLVERAMKLDESVLPGDIINVKESFF
ncbi:exopolysaccharide export protein VpsN [Kistimonas scapharcae]|uniref:Exopolysaccharide export protein VpsN n=1 Tax=Kistimonas scapharcae TaxID=1036133 RepID=A0ABP8UZI9_9GAMM